MNKRHKHVAHTKHMNMVGGPLWSEALGVGPLPLPHNPALIVCVAVRQFTVPREAWPEIKCWDYRLRGLDVDSYSVPALRSCCEINWFDRGTPQWRNPSVYSTGEVAVRF